MNPDFSKLPHKQALWEQLSRFEITSASIGLTFERRLAREQVWRLDEKLPQALLSLLIDFHVLGNDVG